MSLPDIRALLEPRLAAWAAGRVPPLVVAWQSVKFTPPQGMYLRSFILPGQTASLDLAGKHRAYVGAHQISVVAPTGKGLGAAEAVAKAIEALYPLNLRLTGSGLTVQVVSPVTIGSSVPDEDWFLIPVSYSYRADVALV